MKKAKIITDKHYIISDIDKRLYGSFLEQLGVAIYKGIYDPGNPLSDEKGFRKDIIDIIKEIDVPVVRFPGGNYVSGYRWEDGIGDKKQRPSRLDLAWFTTDNNEFGLNEFADWAKKANTEPMMAINLGTRGVESAQDIIEYCNHPSGTYWSDLRIKHGYKEPHNFKMWCLGNEMDGFWQIGTKTPYEYARLANETAKVMKWVDPSIELIACGSSAYHTPTFGEWEATVLDQCYDNIDYISLHSYYDNNAKDSADFLAHSDLFSEFIDSVIATCDYIKGKNKKKKKINLSFDEWNVWSRQDLPYERWSSAQHRIEDIYKLEDALLVGGMLISLINHSHRVKIGCLAQLVNVIAPIMTTDTGYWKQTIFYPYFHASKYGRGTALNAIVDSPKFDTKNFTDVKAIETAIVENQENEEVTLFILNRSLEDDIELSIDLRQYEGYKVIDKIVLYNDDLNAVNTAENPNNVVPYSAKEEVALDGGRLTSAIKKHSWNVIRIGKRG